LKRIHASLKTVLMAPVLFKASTHLVFSLVAIRL